MRLLCVRGCLRVKPGKQVEPRSKVARDTSSRFCLVARKREGREEKTRGKKGFLVQTGAVEIGGESNEALFFLWGEKLEMCGVSIGKIRSGLLSTGDGALPRRSPGSPFAKLVSPASEARSGEREFINPAKRKKKTRKKNRKVFIVGNTAL